MVGVLRVLGQFWVEGCGFRRFGHGAAVFVQLDLYRVHRIGFDDADQSNLRS